MAHQRGLAAPVLAHQRDPLAGGRCAGRRRRAPGRRPPGRHGPAPRGEVGHAAALAPGGPWPAGSSASAGARRSRTAAGRGHAELRRAWVGEDLGRRAHRARCDPRRGPGPGSRSPASRSVFCSATRIDAPSAASPARARRPPSPSRPGRAGRSARRGPGARAAWPAGRRSRPAAAGRRRAAPGRASASGSMPSAASASSVRVDELVAWHAQVHRSKGDLLVDAWRPPRKAASPGCEGDPDPPGELVHRRVRPYPAPSSRTRPAERPARRSAARARDATRQSVVLPGLARRPRGRATSPSCSSRSTSWSDGRAAPA